MRTIAKLGLTVAVLPLLVGGCAVGPDFIRPEPPAAVGYDQARLPVDEQSSQQDQTVTYAKVIPERWWDLFQSQPLGQTLQTVISGNDTLAAARSTLAQSEQAVLAARGGFWPQLDLAASAQRTGGSSSVGSIYSAGPTVSLTPDVFGLTRRTVEQQEALSENQGYLLGEAYLTLTGEAVTQAIAVATARQQIATVQEIIANDDRNLDLVQRKFDAGKAAQTDILTARSQLLGDRTQLATLRQSLSVARHALTVLASRSSADWMPPDFSLDDFSLPHDLPASVPSELVRQRPDILSAEAQLHANSAAIGMATAAEYPAVTLTGSVTREVLSAGGSGTLWSLGAGLTAPLFHGGTLDAQKQAAVEAYNAQLATYRQTVIVAFGQVADALRALDHDAEQVSTLRQSLDVSEASLRLQRVSYDAGKTSLLDLIVAHRALSQAQLSLVSAKAQQLQDSVQFFVVMGGGWRHGDEQGHDAAHVAIPGINNRSASISEQ